MTCSSGRFTAQEQNSAHPFTIFRQLLFKLQFHLGKDNTEKFASTKNQPLKSAKQLFQMTERLITDQTEITGLTTNDWKQPMWKETLRQLIDLFNLRLPKPTSFPTQCHVREASVMNQSKPGKAGSNGLWKHVFSKIWIGSTGSRWSSSGKNFHVSLHCGILDEIQKMMTKSKCEPEQFKGRIIFMSCVQ